MKRLLILFFALPLLTNAQIVSVQDSSGYLFSVNPLTGTKTQLTIPQTGQSGKVLSTDGVRFSWLTPLSNPMTTGGDLIYGGASGTPTRLPNGTANFVLQSNGTTLAPSWVALAGGGNALTSNPLSQFAATTSAQLNSVISDESGTGNMLTTNGDGSALTGLTATQVGLGNVTNESKATMFTNSALTGITNANNLANGWTPVTSAAGTTTLTAASTRNIEITGTTTQTVVLPDATTLSVGTSYHIDNNSTGAVTVNTNGGATLIVAEGISDVNLTCTSIGTSAGVWDYDYSGRGGVNAADMYSVVASDFTLSAALGVQSCFPTTGDVWTVAANTLYEVEGNYIMTTGTTTTKTTAIAFALTTATVNYVSLNVQGWNAVPNTVATAQGTVQMTQVGSVVITATATTAGVGIYFKGMISVGTGGQITPQINFSANPGGTNLMKAGSYIKFRRLGPNTFSTIGNVN